MTFHLIINIENSVSKIHLCRTQRVRIYETSRSSWDSAIPFNSSRLSFFLPTFLVRRFTTPSSSSIILTIIISSLVPDIGATDCEVRKIHESQFLKLFLFILQCRVQPGSCRNYSSARFRVENNSRWIFWIFQVVPGWKK